MHTQHFKLTIAYDGTRYVGWQRQPNGMTVQELIEGALAKLTGARVVTRGSGRTDAGVHARAQVASCSIVTHHSPLTIHRALNAHLPDDVRVLRVQEVDAKFHARFSAKGKEYRYQIDCGKIADPFLRAYAWHHSQPLNVAAMRRAAKLLKGRHDFTALAASRVRRDAAVVCGNSERMPVRTISKLTMTKQGELLTIAVAADGFLYKMVRSIVGALVKVGEGKMTPEELGVLLAGKKRVPLVATAPAKGLFLWRVWYWRGKSE